MLYIVKVLYAFVMPPGGIIALLILLNIYLYRKKTKGRYALTAVIAVFYVLTMQFTAYYLMKPLENAYAPPGIQQLQEAKPDVIVMLGGGAINNVPDIDGDGMVSGYVANRMMTVYRLQKELNVPVILSGGKVFEDTGREADIERRIFNGMGLPDDVLLIENQSRNTVENARNSKSIMEEHGYTRPLLITSGFHMPRSMMIFEREGMKPIAYTADYQMSGQLAFSVFNFIPRNDAFNYSCMAIREYMGIAALKFKMQ